MFLGLLKSIIRTSAFIGKEITEIIRRPGVLVSLVLGPFIIMGLFGLGYSGQNRPLNTLVVVPDSSNLPQDASFYQQIAGSSVNVVGVISDANQARAELQQQQVDLVVVAPDQPQQQFQSGQQINIGVEYNQLDPVENNYTQFVAEQQVSRLNAALIQQAVSNGEQYVVQSGGSQVTQIPPQVLASPTRADLQNVAPITPSVVVFFAPAVLALVLQHMGVTLTALSMIRERTSGAMELFRVAPVRTQEILIGKYLAYLIFNLVIAAIVTVLLVLLIKVPILSGLRPVATVIALLSFASLGLGLLISLLADSERQAVQLSMLLLLASVFFSGFVLPLDEFQPFMHDAAYILPVTHGIQLLQDYMLRGTTNAVWEVWALAGIGVVLFLATAVSLRHSLRTS